MQHISGGERGVQCKAVGRAGYFDEAEMILLSSHARNLSTRNPSPSEFRLSCLHKTTVLSDKSVLAVKQSFSMS